jgi:uncharacterized membrane protein HdeD (DUF308 family)
MDKSFRSSARHLMIFGIITILLGCAAISAPFIAGLSVVMSVGVLVIVGGIVRMLWAFEMGSFGKGLLMFALGGLTLLCGLSLVAHPLFAVGFLSFVIPIYLFADGITEIVAAMQLRESGRTWLLIGGVASIILGVLLWKQAPWSGGFAIGILLGVRLIFAGSAMLAGGSAVRSLGKDADTLLRTAV